MTDISQQKVSQKTNSQQDTTHVDGHKTTVIRGGKATVYWKGMEVTPATHSRPRVGKTRKDAASGAARRNAENKTSRASWQNDTRATIASFPFNSCNGKRNRSVVTGKGNTRIAFIYKVTR